MNNCKCCDDQEYIRGKLEDYFSVGIALGNFGKAEKKTEKMGKITIFDSASKKFDDFKIGECFMRIGNVYMKLKPGNVMDNAVNLENGELASLVGHVEYAPVHEFHWNDKQ